jgi:YbgC/YbaW family acyl-CoA thioester hydrolase
MSTDPSPTTSESRVRVRSYELDAFGHLNHAVYLSYFEHARFETMESRGFSIADMLSRGQGVHVVRVEVDYRREATLGQEILIRTRLDEVRHSSLTLLQRALDPTDPERDFAVARVVAVWIGPDRRPMRVPDDVRRALS